MLFQSQTEIYFNCILEPPDAPQDAKVLEFGSRTAKIGWTAPYSGNSPIQQYIVHYKEEAGEQLIPF